jgi:hypothetical protein
MPVVRKIIVGEPLIRRYQRERETMTITEFEESLTARIQRFSDDLMIRFETEGVRSMVMLHLEDAREEWRQRLALRQSLLLLALACEATVAPTSALSLNNDPSRICRTIAKPTAFSRA